jgi:ATP-dependent protease ClpP protease subunit/Skp family chaperone for outer membrane proteins
MNWYRIDSQVGANGEVDLFIFDEIGIWGIGADKVINEIQRLKPTQINLHVNSPGGSIVDGLAIFNYLRSHSANVTTYVDSLAASIAGVIAMAGDEVVMLEASLFHMHLPGISGWVDMKVDGIEEMARGLRKMDEVLRGIYKRRTGAEDSVLEEWFSGETYFTAQEALDLGLIDRIEERARMVACAGNWNAKNYPSVQKALARHPDGPVTQRKETTDMSKALEDQVASLTSTKADLAAKNKQLEDQLKQEKDSRQEAIDTAVNKAKTDTLDAQTKRIESINALAKKHGKDGDLDALANQAIAEGKSADDFKDDVLEAIAKRPTTPRAENGGGENGNGGDAKTINSEEYLAMSLPERRKFKADGGKVVDEA